MNDTPPVKLTPATSEGHIRDVVLRSYTSTDPADCERIFTTAFVHAAWQDADGCRKHLHELATIPPAEQGHGGHARRRALACTLSAQGR